MISSKVEKEESDDRCGSSKINQINGTRTFIHLYIYGRTRTCTLIRGYFEFWGEHIAQVFDLLAPRMVSRPLIHQVSTALWYWKWLKLLKILNKLTTIANEGETKFYAHMMILLIDVGLNFPLPLKDKKKKQQRQDHKQIKAQINRPLFSIYSCKLWAMVW